MSSIAPFVVGLIASGAGYAYLSRDLVTSRNELMMKYFKADGVEPYYPGAKIGRRRRDRASRHDTGSGSDSSGIGSGRMSPPHSVGDHDVVKNAQDKWNAAVFKCSEVIVGALYGGKGGGDEGAKANGDDDVASQS